MKEFNELAEGGVFFNTIEMKYEFRYHVILKVITKNKNEWFNRKVCGWSEKDAIFNAKTMYFEENGTKLVTFICVNSQKISL